MEIIIDKKKVQNIEAIEGFLTRNEGLLLYSLARMQKPHSTIVEVGSWKGKSTAWLSHGMIDGGSSGSRVVAVDHGIGDSGTGPENSRGAFLQNMQKSGVSNVIDPIFKKSEDAIKGWQKPIDLLFIDAAHDFENVKKDFLWEEYLSDGGLIVLHDGLEAVLGPAGMYIQRVLNSGDFKNFGTVDSILFAQKTAGHKGNILRRKILTSLLRFNLILGGFYNRSPKQGFRKTIMRILMKSILRKIIGLVANYRLDNKFIIV